MKGNGIVFAGLMPHAPVLVPGVGGENLSEVRQTVSAMTALARQVLAAHPDTVVVVSPHSPRRAGAFALWTSPRLRGSFERFGSPEDTVDLPLDCAFVERLVQEAQAHGLRTWTVAGKELDHGATVPLHYLAAAGWHGPTVVVGLNDSGAHGCDELGRAISGAARTLHRRVALIASGDMSHRLTLTAPCGFHPEAHRFDEAFIALLRKEATVDLSRLDHDLQDTAAEDVVESTQVALGATGHATEGHDVLSYEGPFGVGYGVAVLYEPAVAKGRRPAGHPRAGNATVLESTKTLPMVARCALEAGLESEASSPPFDAAGELTARHGVFVTLRTADGELRGCAGTPAPRTPDLVQETWRSAMVAAFHDPRFAAVRSGELPSLHLGVTILDPPEPAASAAELDPAKYGVIVSSGGRRGLLLPAIEGITTVDEQLRIARSKAGIGPDEEIRIQRFTARCVEEHDPADEEGSD